MDTGGLVVLLLLGGSLAAACAGWVRRAAWLAAPLALAGLALAAALASASERVEIDYYTFGRDEVTTRRIDPRAVFAAAGQWYVDAYCHRAEDDRLFRVDRVRGVRPTGEHFDPAASAGTTEGGLFHPRPSDRRVTLGARELPGGVGPGDAGR